MVRQWQDAYYEVIIALAKQLIQIMKNWQNLWDVLRQDVKTLNILINILLLLKDNDKPCINS